MNIDLVRKLVKEGVIRQNTEIDAFYMGYDISGRAIARVRGTFFVQNVKLVEATGKVVFETISTIDGNPRRVESSEVQSVDGMPLERLACIYGIDAGGGTIEQGKRRGRKPRAKLTEAA